MLERMLTAARETVDELFEKLGNPTDVGRPLFIVTSGDGSSLHKERPTRLTRRQKLRYGHRLEEMTELLIGEVGSKTDPSSEWIPEARLEHLAAEIRIKVPECVCTFALDEAVQGIARAYTFGDRGAELLFGRCGIWWFIGHRM